LEGIQGHSSVWQICRFFSLSTVENAQECDRKPRATARNSRLPKATTAQQPRQIFFNRAFITASSALIESTYFAVSTFEAGARGFAAADDAGDGAARS
jgi:hypothetical protein